MTHHPVMKVIQKRAPGGSSWMVRHMSHDHFIVCHCGCAWFSD